MCLYSGPEQKKEMSILCANLQQSGWADAPDEDSLILPAATCTGRQRSNPHGAFTCTARNALGPAWALAREDSHMYMMAA